MTDTPLRFAVLAEDATLPRLLEEAFEESGLAADVVLRIDTTLDEGVEHAAKLRWADIQILVAEVGRDLGAAVEGLARVATEAPGASVILTGPGLPSDALLKLIRAGAMEYLPNPVDAGDLAAALRRVVSKRGAMEGVVRHPGRIFCILGAKGGSGVSTTAVNLALEVRALSGEPTLLVDFDLLEGGLELLLDLQPRYTIVDVVGSFHRLDEGLLKSFIMTHSSGLDVLAAPRTALEGEQVSPEQAAQLLRVLRGHYARVIVDMGNVLTSVALGAMTEADELMMVLVPHLEALRNAKRSMATVRKVAPQLTKDLHVVVNRFTPDPPIAIPEVERTLDAEVQSILLLDEAMARRTASGGRPAALSAPSKYGKQLRALAVAATGVQSSSRQRGLLSSLFGRFLHRNGSKAPASQRARTSAK